MGQGDPFGEHQAGVTRSTPAEYSVTPVPRIVLLSLPALRYPKGEAAERDPVALLN